MHAFDHLRAYAIDRPYACFDHPRASAICGIETRLLTPALAIASNTEAEPATQTRWGSEALFWRYCGCAGRVESGQGRSLQIQGDQLKGMGGGLCFGMWPMGEALRVSLRGRRGME